MPGQLKKGTERVSYVESSDIHKALKILAVYKSVFVSDLMRIATEDFLKKEDPKGIFLEEARKTRIKKSGIPKKRGEETVDPEILALAQKLQKKLGRKRQSQSSQGN